MTSYKLLQTSYSKVIQKTDDNGVVSSIPFDPANTDYQQYLAWLAEGNQPEPADI
jgi:hypothetical protein